MQQKTSEEIFEIFKSWAFELVRNGQYTERQLVSKMKNDWPKYVHGKLLYNRIGFSGGIDKLIKTGDLIIKNDIICAKYDNDLFFPCNIVN